MKARYSRQQPIHSHVNKVDYDDLRSKRIGR
jgi:hypothetical protein